MDASEILLYLEIAIAIILIVVLYHVLFVAVDLRKILRRIDDVTREVEDVIMKPLSMVDSILQWVLDIIEESQEKGKKSKHTKHLKHGD